LDIGWAVTKPDWQLLGRWILWIGLLAGSTALLLRARGDIDQSHVALTLLLVVLGGSAGGGRALGFTLAILGFLLIDYLFQAPYDLISVDKPLDWAVLVAFLSAAFVATELLTRARSEADEARQRGDEVVALARLGSETLRYAGGAEGLGDIADLVQSTLAPRRTAIRLFEDGGRLAAAPVAARGADPVDAEERIVELVAADDSAEHVGLVAASLPDGSVLRGSSLDEIAASRPTQTIVLPLVLESRRLGLMLIGADRAARQLSGPQRRFLTALAHYAALGAERLRLAREAEHTRAVHDANRVKDEVIATVSHDLRAPLTAIKLLAQSARARGDPSGRPIEDEVDRLAEFVTNVLDLSRIRAEGITLDFEMNAAEDLIGAAVARATPLLKGRTVQPRIDLNAPVLTGWFDFVQSLRILGNLLDNALRYTPIGGSVEVQACREGPWLAIHVADRGPGVVEIERERIFEAFYRPRAETPDVGHAGLGLSIARRLAELQGGTVTYSRRPGGGSNFTLRLRASESADGAELAAYEGQNLGGLG
jgi:two-component system, OmpR family, sensor histidine kinase KdpD